MKHLLRFALLYLGLCSALALASVLFTPPCSEWRGHRDIGVVLGAGTTKTTLSRTTLTRIDAAVALYHNGQVTRLHVTGGSRWLQEPMGPLMAETLASAGVPRTAISWETHSYSTLENALYSKPFLPRDASLVVVTEGYHALRGAASLMWAGRPAAFCAAPTAYPSDGSVARALLRETLAWAYNIVRGAAYALARAAGQEDALPRGFLE